MCLGSIPSLPGAPSFRLFITCFTSFVLAGFKKNEDWRLSGIKVLWEIPPVLIFDARVGPMFIKKVVESLCYYFRVYCNFII